MTLRFHDAGHILGSAIVELIDDTGPVPRKLVFSGDLGYREAPIMESPAKLEQADAVLLESTYGDRLHRPFDHTMQELTEVFEAARADQDDLAEWYGALRNRPPVYLVHGESDAQQKLASRLQQDFQAPVTAAAMNQLVEI